MAKGRKPLPREIKELQGTLENSRDNKELPNFGKVQSVRSAPKQLSSTEKLLYLDICRDLIVAGVLESPDLAIVAQLVIENTRYYKNIEYLRKNGYTGIDPRTGKRYSYPENTLADRALRSVQSLSAELGLTPASRQRLRIGTAKEPEVKKTDMQNLLD